MLHWPFWAPHVGLGEDFTQRRRRARPRFTVFKSLLCRDSVHTCIKFVTAAHICSFKRHSNPLIHTGGKMVGDVWLQWSQSTALMPSPPPLPQKGPYRASLFRQNSLTFEYARNQLHGCSRTKQTSALQQHAKKRVFFFCAISTIQYPPLPLSFISVCTPCRPISSHADPPRRCSALPPLNRSPPGSRPPGTPADRAASRMLTAGGTQRVRGDRDLSEVAQEGWKKSDPPASSPWAVPARSTLPAGRRSALFLEYASSWTGCVRKYNHSQISPRLGYRTAFRRHALQSSLEGLAGGSAARSAHDPFWLSSRIMTPAAWVI